MMQNGYVFDPDDPSELTRLLNLDRAMTACMGGPLAGGIASHQPLTQILDLACGPGGWVLETAFALREREVEVAGVDSSASMISYACASKRTQQRANASFEVMDITQPLDFADGAFDLINARFLVGVLKGRQQWEKVLKECLRLLRPGGMIRLAESDGVVISTSKRLSRLQSQLNLGMHQRGYGCSADDGMTLGITSVLSHLLREAGFHQVNTQPFLFDGSHPTGEWGICFRLCEYTYYLALSQGLLDGMALASGETIAQVIHRMLIDIQTPGFGCLTYGALVTAFRPGEEMFASS